MRFRTIASGSNGNCVFIEEGEDRFLVDAGISAKSVKEGLQDLGVLPEELTGILVTHAHGDHVRGLQVFLKHFRTPFYGTAETLAEIRATDREQAIPAECYHTVNVWEPFRLGRTNILPIATKHDSAGSCGYRFDAARCSVAVLTDLGSYDDRTVEALQRLDGILVESNHDTKMLEVGPYPYVLKRRILGDYGHLSNDRCASLVTKILHPDLKFILLGHISEENNLPELALMTVKQAINDDPGPYRDTDFRIEAASRYAPSEIFEL
ncbi:MAG: MBL fold metallo-hydrolase [Lachnospiraceae bacterium]|nr:MBL fold metallo-hydrolase [Lachnospiraceae bacterium]